MSKSIRDCIVTIIDILNKSIQNEKPNSEETKRPI